MTYTVQSNHVTHELTIHTSGDSGRSEIVVTVPAFEVLRFAHMVMNEAINTAGISLRAALTGDCPTCMNVRLVPERTHVGTSAERIVDVRCPDCGPRFDNPPPIPTPAYGFAQRDRDETFTGD